MISYVIVEYYQKNTSLRIEKGANELINNRCKLW